MKVAVVVACLASSLSLALAGFDAEQLNGLYRLRAGTDQPDTRCGDLLRFSSSGVSVPAKDISVDKESCSGGTLTLVKNPAQGTSGFIRFFSGNRRSGDFYAGSLSARLACGSTGFGIKSTFVFVRPERDIFLTWDDVAGFQTPIELATGASYTFRSGVTYILFNNRCMFVRDDAPNSLSTEDRASCFPSGATAELEFGTRVPIEQLRIGDSVAVGPRRFSKVIAWTHRDANARVAKYIRIDVGHHKPLIVTPSHYVYANDRAVPARQVKVGDIMPAADGRRLVSLHVDEVDAWGLYNPQTLDGDIVIEGLVVSTYTDALQDTVAHGLLAPVRAIFRWSGRVDVFIEEISRLGRRFVG